MAGARPSTFKKGGGGFLNNVDGVILDYELSTEFQGGKGPAKRVPGKEPFEGIYALLTVRVDGAADPQPTNLLVASQEDFDIDDDGKTLNPKNDNAMIPGVFGWAAFMDSMVKNGFDENELPEDSFNWEAIVGQRCRFVQEKDEFATQKLGKRKDAKTGKSYDRTRLVVSAVYGKDAAKGKTTKAKVASLDDRADEVLSALLTKKGGSLLRSKLPVALAQHIGAKDENREALRKLIYSMEYLEAAAERGIVEVDSKTEEITLAA